MSFVLCFNNSFICLNCFIYHWRMGVHITMRVWRRAQLAGATSSTMRALGTELGSLILVATTFNWLNHLDDLFVLVLVFGLVFDMGCCYVA